MDNSSQNTEGEDDVDPIENTVSIILLRIGVEQVWSNPKIDHWMCCWYHDGLSTKQN